MKRYSNSILNSPKASRYNHLTHSMENVRLSKLDDSSDRLKITPYYKDLLIPEDELENVRIKRSEIKNQKLKRKQESKTRQAGAYIFSSMRPKRKKKIIENELPSKGEIEDLIHDQNTPRKEPPKQSILDRVKDGQPYSNLRNIGLSVVKKIKKNNPDFNIFEKKVSFVTVEPSSPKVGSLSQILSPKGYTIPRTKVNLLLTKPNKKPSPPLPKEVSNDSLMLSKQSASSKARINERLRRFHAKAKKRRKKTDSGKEKVKLLIDDIERIWHYPFVKSRMQRILSHCKNLNVEYLTSVGLKTGKKTSFQEYLTAMTSNNSLPKYNGLNALPLKDSFLKSKKLYEDFCKEIEDFYIEIANSEQKIIGLVRTHEGEMKIREKVRQRIKERLSRNEVEGQKKFYKNFRDARSILDQIVKVERNTTEIAEPDDGVNRGEMIDLRMKKYNSDWEKVGLIECKNWRMRKRKKNREGLSLEYLAKN